MKLPIWKRGCGRQKVVGDRHTWAHEDNAEVRRFRLSIQQIKRNFTSSNGVLHWHKTDKIICSARVVVATSRSGSPER